MARACLGPALGGKRFGLDRQEACDQDRILARLCRLQVAVGELDREPILSGADSKCREVHSGLGGADVLDTELLQGQTVGLCEIRRCRHRVVAQPEATGGQERNAETVVYGLHRGGNLGGRDRRLEPRRARRAP